MLWVSEPINVYYWRVRWSFLGYSFLNQATIRRSEVLNDFIDINFNLCEIKQRTNKLVFVSSLMQPSMANLNSPSSRIVKDATPFRRRILRCINFGNGESSPNNFLDEVNLYLIKFKERWILNERALNYSFIILLFESESLPKKINHLGESSPNFIFAGVNLDPIVFEKRWTDGESWPNDFVEKVNRGEDLRWVGSRCPLTHALNTCVEY